MEGERKGEKEEKGEWRREIGGKEVIEGREKGG
jgi:hypothetical protein